MPSPMIFGLGSFAVALIFLIFAIRRYRLPSGGLRPDSADIEESLLKESGQGHTGLRRWGALLRPEAGKPLEELRQRTMHAGLYSQEELDIFLTVRLSLMLGGLVLVLLLAALIVNLMVWLLIFMVVVVVVVVGPSFWLDTRKQSRHREIGNTLPYLLDLLAVCLDAGLGLQQALERISVKRHYGSDLLAGEIRTVLAELKAGVPMEIAFRKLAMRFGMDELNTITLLISQTAHFGTNISQMLREHIRVFRQNRLMMLEEKAGQANAKLTLPLCLLLLPATLILLLGPAVIQIARTFN